MTRLTLVLALACASCSRSHLGRAAEEGDGPFAATGSGAASVPDRASAGTVLGSPRVLRGNGEGGAPSQHQAGSLAPTVTGPEVWIGEYWSLSDDFCDPAQPAKVTGDDPPQARSLRVVLMIERAVDPSAATGRIRFAQGELPSEPETWPITAETQNFYTCSKRELALGGEYSLLDAQRSSQRLVFELAPAEIWQPWCTRKHVYAWSEDGPNDCPCDVHGCRPKVGVRIPFVFGIEGNTMNAVFGHTGTTAIRLKRVQ